MSVGFNVKFYWYQIGSADFLHAFFSTVAFNLEDSNWGSRFPVLMNELYQGKVSVDKLDDALSELKTIQSELQALPVDKVVWEKIKKTVR